MKLEEIKDKYADKQCGRVRMLDDHRHGLWKERHGLIVEHTKLKDKIAEKRHTERIQIITKKLIQNA